MKLVPKIHAIDCNLSQLRSFMFVMIHDIPANQETRGKKKRFNIAYEIISLQLIMANRCYVIWAYPTALKRQLLSEGMTLLNTVPSMLWSIYPENNHNHIGCFRMTCKYKWSFMFYLNTWFDLQSENTSQKWIQNTQNRKQSKQLQCKIKETHLLRGKRNQEEYTEVYPTYNLKQ